jgi:hypothetical protein
VLIAELALAPATRRALRVAGITTIEQLQRSANELLDIEPITGAVLHNIVCCLHAQQLGLDPSRRWKLPTELDIEMLRLRVVEGLTLRGIALNCGLSPERVRQRLNQRFGLNGEPPAVLENRRLRARRLPDWEYIIAMRLRRSGDGLPMAILLQGFSKAPLSVEARNAVRVMEARGLLSVDTDRVRPTEALRGSNQLHQTGEPGARDSVSAPAPAVAPRAKHLSRQSD